MKVSKVSDVDEQWLRRLCVPKVHWKCRFTEIPDRCSHKKPLRQYLEKINFNVLKGRGLYLWGDFGRGKSGAAAVCLVHAATHGFVGFWLRARDLPGYVINQTDFDEEQTVIERAKECPILVIDEFQIRYSETKFSEWSVEDLVRSRVDDGLATIITSNLTLTVLEEKYPALYSVLQEGIHPIKVQGYDFRKGMVGKDGHEDV